MRQILWNDSLESMHLISGVRPVPEISAVPDATTTTTDSTSVYATAYRTGTTALCLPSATNATTTC